jgi:arginyl-tRNA synthetase
MLEAYRRELARIFENRVRELYDVDVDVIVEVPPRRQLGDLAMPGALQLARVLKRNPRQIGEEIADGFPAPHWVREIKVEGAGFLNVYLDRGAVVAGLLAGDPLSDDVSLPAEKIVVEHTNINPNKAAHIGHLRNAVLGDILARLLRSLGHTVEIQNYIDDTGVQLADVVVGFLDLRSMSADEIAAVEEPFDFFCWDLYSEVGAWYEEDEARLEHRRETLRALEHDSGPRAEVGRLVAARVVKRHLETMARLGIGYDLLTHESAILGCDFFSQALELLKDGDAIRMEEGGKNAGCWVMPLSESEEFAGLEDPDKVIVRSDGTATYVGKDIAYQLWKFGLLGRDFAYRLWDEVGVWQSVVEGVPEHPSFGAAERVINVIDARQSYLQKVVRVGLERLGHHSQAERSIHFAYEMVSLSTGAARQLGFLGDEEEGEARSLEMSGRKGIGVKADDLLDQLLDKSREEIRSRNRELEGEELEELATSIATAALRFFMAKATTTRVIAFDFDEALNFEGESGPYLLYSLVRVGNIWRKLAEAGIASQVTPEEAAALPAELWQDDLWELIFAVAQTPGRVRNAGDSLEISLLARHALELAQKLNALYHKHPMLHEKDDDVRAARLATTQVFDAGMRAMCGLLGLPTPARM